MKRYFTEEELAEMAKPVPDRIIECIKNHDYKKAIMLCLDVKDEFLFLHDLYVNMIVSTLTFISEKCGEAMLGEALEYQHGKCVKEQLTEKISSLSVREKIIFLAGKVFGTDSCYGTGMPRSKFNISEDDTAIIFTLSPCGSGGRLIRGGAYKPLTFLKKIRESVENKILMYIARLPIPDSIASMGILRDRRILYAEKTTYQGCTKNEYPWSFGKKDIPYFCCQCGMLASKTLNGCIDINYPKKKNDPCIWKIKKR